MLLNQGEWDWDARGSTRWQVQAWHCGTADLPLFAMTHVSSAVFCPKIINEHLKLSLSGRIRCSAIKSIAAIYFFELIKHCFTTASWQQLCFQGELVHGKHVHVREGGKEPSQMCKHPAVEKTALTKLHPKVANFSTASWAFASIVFSWTSTSDSCWRCSLAGYN